MKDKILVLVLTVLIGTNVGACMYYNNDLSLAQKTISTLEAEDETKSTKIAKLEYEIKSKNQNLFEMQNLIDNQKSTIKKQKKKIDSQNKKIDSQKRKIENFNEKKKGSDVGVRQLTVEATAYTAYCPEGCTGRTATGVDVSKTIYYKGYRVIAVDTRLIRLNSLVKVETINDTFTAVAIDTGGAIKGHIIDVLVSNENVARNFGRQKAKLTILKEGE